MKPMSTPLRSRIVALFQVAVTALALVAATGLAPAPAWAQDPRTKEAGGDFGIGIVAVFANLVYMPVKLTYGILGGITGSLAYVLSGANRDVADGVWVPSLGGDYVLTAEMMKGREPVHFNGVRSESRGDDEEESSGF